MSTLRLNAAAVRGNDLPVRSPDREYSGVLDSLGVGPLLISRRDLLKATGATVALGAVCSRTLEPLVVAETGAHAKGAWLRAGGHRAVLDPAAFAGSPQLTVSDGGGWQAVLEGARYPGVEIPAGMALSVTGTGALARLRIVHEFGGFDAEVPLSAWLAGERAAKAPVRLGTMRFDLGDGHRLTLSGTATATLSTDWSLRLEGPQIARLTGFGGRVVASAVTIALAADDASTLLSRRIARRSLITLEAGDTPFKIAAPKLGDEGILSIEAGALDRVTIEAAETRMGAAYRAAVAFSSNGGAASYRPGASVSGASMALPLKHLRVARMLDGGGAFHLAADYADPTWVQALGRTLLLGGAPWVKPFEVRSTSAGIKLHAEPAVKGVAADLPGAIASPLHFPDTAEATVRLAGAGVGVGHSGKGGAVAPIGAKTEPATIPLPHGTYVYVTRPDDLLKLRFELFNIALGYGDTGRPFLMRRSPNMHAYISVTFPGQHAVERAYRESQTPGPAPFEAYLADESRLAFLVADDYIDGGIDYSLLGAAGDGVGGLLDWSHFTHVVVEAAQATVNRPDLSTGADPMGPPWRGNEAGNDRPMYPPETSLEVPWGLYMSPEPGAFWTHRTAPLTPASSGRTELWHTRLHGARYRIMFDENGEAVAPASDADSAFRPPDGGWREKEPTLRSVWSRYYDVRLSSSVPAAPTAGLFRNSFTTDMVDSSPDIGGIKHRWAITDLSGRYHEDPIHVNLLLLTSLGAWMDSRATWDTEEIAKTRNVATTLTQWDHRMTMGRDQFVKIVEFGRLFPFGHKAVKVTQTERKVKYTNPFAFLEQQTFIMVKEPILDFSLEADPINRGFPFKRVEIKTLQTLSIDAGTVLGVHPSKAFWPIVVATGTDVQWNIEATDWDGVIHKFTMPMIYLDGFLAGKYDLNMPYLDASIRLGACATAIKAKQISLNGKTVAFAKKPGSDDAKARVLPTNWIKFTAAIFNPDTAGAARYAPLMDSADVQLDALEEMTNQRAGVTIKIAQLYRDSGYGGGNAVGKVFAEIPTAPVVDFPAELSGALATPIPIYSGLSALKGAVGGSLADVGAGNFRPEQMFEVLNAKIIGGVKLIDVLGALIGIDEMPVFEKVKDALDADTLVVQFDWQTSLKSSTTEEKPSESEAIFVAGSGATLKLHADIKKKLKDATAPPSSTVTGELGPFTLQLVPPLIDAIHIEFKSLKFESLDGGSPKVSPQIGDVTFVGPLAYLQELAKYLAMGSGSTMLAAEGANVEAITVIDEGPFKVDVDASGISVSLTLQLPDVTIGVFSLKNMSFGAGLTLPFDGSAVLLDFNFCSREAPFELLVMGFGGGGYVLMQLATDGLRMIEISLEFGAGTTFSIGSLASGSVEIKGGLTFRYEKIDTGDKLTFIVFIRIHGSLEVIGLITVTVTFYLELRYESWDKAGGKGDKLTGTATLTIEIEILFFSTSVDLSVTKTLAGKDPRFGDRMPEQSDWDEYCAAFAPAQVGA